eukprot:715567-Ditylum_brightwellii.AAC.1
MRVNGGSLQLYKKFTDQNITCICVHTCLLVSEEMAAHPYYGLFRRPRHAPLLTPDENQPDVNESELTQ